MPSNPTAPGGTTMTNWIKKTCWLLFILLTIINCCKKDRVEISERYEDGKKKVLSKYTGSGELLERVRYNKAGQVTRVENAAGNSIKLVQWHKNGRKKSETWYKDGKKQGKWRQWYTSGQIKNEKVYAEGKLICSISYNKEITSETIYQDGQLSISREYRDGIISLEKEYQSGKLMKARWFYPDGSICEEGEYREGKQHGRWIYWDRNNKFHREVFYREGKLIRETLRTAPALEE
jgi:YD repeat-containing protein